MEKWMMMNADVSFPILFILASRKQVITSLLRAHSSLLPPSFPVLFKQSNLGFPFTPQHFTIQTPSSNPPNPALKLLTFHINSLTFSLKSFLCLSLQSQKSKLHNFHGQDQAWQKGPWLLQHQGHQQSRSRYLLSSSLSDTQIFIFQF